MTPLSVNPFFAFFPSIVRLMQNDGRKQMFSACRESLETSSDWAAYYI